MAIGFVSRRVFGCRSDTKRSRDRRVLTKRDTFGSRDFGKWLIWFRRAFGSGVVQRLPANLLVSNRTQPPSQHRYRRRRITWPVTVQADNRRLHGETLDVGPQGAKLRLPERPDVGTCITLHLTPSDGHAIAVQAIVWRHDEDGVVVFFLSKETGIWEREGRHAGARTGDVSSRSPETILVVDDEAKVLDVVGDSLEAVGYKVLKT